ncbi:MAG: copper amine oxidase N-terminal domain-containing protein [Ruminococcaceae bacterium]|nr:copper amine oxidase N-terminal domain-containing protein [Oscillospiraceae bacterium]
MNKLLKAAVCCILIISLSTSSPAFSASYKAVVPTFNVLVGGERFYSEPPVIVIDGRTYLPLRALGDCLGVHVEWNDEAGQVEVDTTKEVLQKEPAAKNGYDKFDDVPDFGKVTKTKLVHRESSATDFGYVTSFAYSLTEDNLSSSVSSYVESVLLLGFDEYFYDNSDNQETILLLNEKTGRLINLVLNGNIMVITIFEQLHTVDEWMALDEGKSLPQKEYEALEAGFKVYVDGKEFVSENPPLVVDGRTYLPLKAMGDCLGVFVEWNSSKGQVEVTK